MIKLFEENEIQFSTLGLGVLKDAKTCIVKEELNDSFELELTYPIEGVLYDKIKIGRIIVSKVDPYNEEQPFRIYAISKPINGIVTVNAVHISYDMNGIPVKPINGTSVRDTLDKIQNGTIIPHNFKLYTDKSDAKTFTTHNYYNMRALLLGTSESVLEKYEGESYFNKFDVYILQHRGSNKGAQVRYAKNLKDITHEINYDRLYNKVYPFYHKETTSQTATSEAGEFKQVYIVGSKPYQDGWLSYSDNGEPYHPVDESPVQIATEGNFFQKVYTWNTITQRYSERIYNESVTLIDSLGNLLSTEQTPSWIYIDWSGLPRIVVKANSDGYFKTITDSDWKKCKKDDIVLDASIKDAATSLVMYYSEVIPSSSAVVEEESTEVTHVELKDKLIEINTDLAKKMLYDRVLMLDLSSEFDETPTEDKLETKAKEYIEKNKIGQYKYNTSVSFVDLSSTTESIEYTNFEKIELGDTVKVVYEDLGVDVDLRVVGTNYNAILNRYDKIILGETPEKISGESVQYGDDVSSLTNDVGYADVNTVNKLIAKLITADLIEAKNAKLSKAQIEELSSARIKVTGLIEATQFELDTLIAKMLIADNAKIKETLEAGQIKVKGDIEVTKGQITIQSTSEDGSSIVFKVDRDGNVEANSVKISGGELNINDTFVVTPDGIMTAMGASVSGDIVITSGSITLGSKFRVDPDGTMHASNASISGDISATTGHIAGFIIKSDRLHDSNNKIMLSPGKPLTVDSLYKKWTILSGLDINSTGQYPVYSAKFKVADDGSLYASEATINGKITSNDATISGGSITITDNGTEMFKVTNKGVVTAKDINISGGSLNINDKFVVTPDGIMTANGATIQNGNITITSGSILIQDLNQNTSFSVDQYGNLSANSVNITGGTLSITGSKASVRIYPNGTLAANNAIISGIITAASGNIGGFTITDKGLYYGFTPSAPVHAQGYGVYIGPDAIRLGNDISRNYYYPSASSYENVNGSSIETATLFDISDSSNPTDYYNGARFKITASETKSEDRQYIFIPCKSASISDPDLTSKMISVTIPANKTQAYVTLYTKYPVTDSNDIKHAYYAVYEQNSLGGSIRLTLDMLGGFTVTADGLVTMYNAQVKGSFIGDVNITGGQLNIDNKFIVTQTGEVTINAGSINIKDDQNTTTFSVSSTGYMEAKNVNISGGTIGGLNITSSSLWYGGSTSIDAVLSIIAQQSGDPDPRSPNYQVFADSIYSHNYIFGRRSSDTEDTWAVIKDSTSSSQAKYSGFYTYYSSINQEAEVRGFIPARYFNLIPYFDFIANPVYNHGNPRMWLLNHTIDGNGGTYEVTLSNCYKIVGVFAMESSNLNHTGNITAVVDGSKVTFINRTGDTNAYWCLIIYYPNDIYGA